MILEPITSGNLALKPTDKRVVVNNHHKDRSQEVFPIKDKDVIQKIKSFYLARRRYRDYALFTFGINVGMRCGDMLRLKWSDLLDDDGAIVEQFTIKEEKTNKFRTIHVNQSAADGLRVYLEKGKHSDLATGFIFNGKGTDQLKVNSVYRMLS